MPYKRPELKRLSGSNRVATTKRLTVIKNRPLPSKKPSSINRKARPLRHLAKTEGALARGALGRVLGFFGKGAIAGLAISLAQKQLGASKQEAKKRFGQKI